MKTQAKIKTSSPTGYVSLSSLYTRNPLMGTLANSEDPDEMQQNAAFHQGLPCLPRLKQPSGTEIH